MSNKEDAGIKYPKILVCTVNSWNSKIGDNTFPSLLKDFPKENIASLFIREDMLDLLITENYFRISEIKVLRSIFSNNEKVGEYVVSNVESEKQNDQRNMYNRKKHFYYTKMTCREIVWKLGKWKNTNLNSFIDDYAPDIVIYEMSRYIHLNNIVMYILKRTGAKGIGCFWDDTFTYKQSKKIPYKIFRFFQRRNLQKLAKNTASFFSISEKTKLEADEYFNINSTILTKPINNTNIECNKISNISLPISLLYTGNLGIGRLDALELLIKSIKKYNEDNIIFKLDIYTNTYIEDKLLQKLECSYVCFHKSIPQEEVVKKQKESDVLIFLESFDENNKMARLSFSTKITDYYSAGKCILALGNEDLASIYLFIKNDSAIVVTNENEIINALKKLENVDVINEYSEKSYLCGKNNHSKEMINDTFKKILFNIQK